MFASRSVDVVTAIAVEGRGWAGGGIGVPVIRGVDLVIAVLMSMWTSPLSEGELALMSTSSLLLDGELC